MLPFLLTWVQFTEITQLLVEFFVVKEHLRMASFSSLTTDKCLSTQKAWHGTCNIDILFSAKLMMMHDVRMRLSPGTLWNPVENLLSVVRYLDKLFQPNYTLFTHITQLLLPL